MVGSYSVMLGERKGKQSTNPLYLGIARVMQPYHFNTLKARLRKKVEVPYPSA